MKWAGGLAIVSAVLNFGLGVLTLVQRNPYIQGVMDDVARCKDQGIGVGAAVTTTDTSDFITLCKSLGDYTAAQYDTARSALLVTAIVLIVVGLGSGWAGFGVIKGTRRGRLMMTVLGILLLVATMLQILSSPLVLLSALLMLIGLSLLYIGKGATYYIRAKAKGVK